MCEGSNSLKLSNITLGGELSNQSILNALSSIYTDAKIRHIYASTEVGVGFSVTDALEGFPTSLLVDSGMDFKLKISSEGELLIKKDILSQSFIDITKYTENEYFCTGDLVELIGERVYFRGRKSGLINVGGIKVTPEKIENVLLSMPEISDAKVYAVESSMMGNLVGAQIIKVDDNLNAKKIKEFCNTKLPKQEVPVMIKFVTHFKLTNTGKIERS